MKLLLEIVEIWHGFLDLVSKTVLLRLNNGLMVLIELLVNQMNKVMTVQTKEIINFYLLI